MNNNISHKVYYPVLSIENVSKYFGKKQVLYDIGFSIEKGEIFGLLGPNGSGKTTTIKLVLGLLEYKTGSIKICGYNIKNDFLPAISHVGAIIENPELYKGLTGKQNLLQFARMYDDISMQRIEEVAAITKLSNRINDKVSTYSLGMRQRLGVAQAILHRPKLLVLDEPINGLDPQGIKEFRELMKELSKTYGVSILISSHILSELENFCDKVCIINSGKIVSTKTLDEIHNENNQYYILKTVETELTKNILIENNIKITKIIDNRIIVSGSFANANNLLKLLLMNNINIISFSPVEKTLEEVFIEEINKSGGSIL